MNRICTLAGLMILSTLRTLPQSGVSSIGFDSPVSLAVSRILPEQGSMITLGRKVPFFTVMIDSTVYGSYEFSPRFGNDTIRFFFSDSLNGWITQVKDFHPGMKYILHFSNSGSAARKIENLVPLGESQDKVYITASGSKEWPGYLCRSKLFRPGLSPVGVILPDNAWHLGFADLKITDSLSIAALARRSSRDKEKTEIDRWAVTLKQGGWAEYNLFFDLHGGDWHKGLKMMFQDRWLYDLTEFDNTLFIREDLDRMKNRYLMLLQFAWDKKYYDRLLNKYTFYKDLFEYDSLTGGFDIYTLWPTWPRLGLDQRNQWDMYKDLPGGVEELRKQADFCHAHGKQFFISYNPWDEGTRKEDQFEGMEKLLRQTLADGVVLDTRGASSLELQATADKVKPGIIMYSEGMAVPKDMPGIVSGRVHDALVLPPPLNLNKLIKPDFAIFRVLQLADDRLHRELAISFFNGYGTEINTMRPGRPDWIREEFGYMGKTVRLLRENNSVFHNYNFFPLVPAISDSIYVNRWETEEKVVFTLISFKPEGYDGPLFRFDPGELKAFRMDSLEGCRFLDLWNHDEISPEKEIAENTLLIAGSLEPFDRSWLNTRREGNVGCIAVFKKRIQAVIQNGKLTFKADGGDKIAITAGNPGYSNHSENHPASGASVSIKDHFGQEIRKIVLQLFDREELLDECVFYLRDKYPRKIDSPSSTEITSSCPDGMVEIPAGEFRFYTVRDKNTLEPFIPFPDYSDTTTIPVHRSYMDRYPVTNKQFRSFIRQTGYLPTDTSGYLRHWKNGEPAAGDEDMPVVFINLEDAKAYAAWQGKRLPSEIEWQYAAQGTDMRKYPWGNEMDSTKCNFNLNFLTPVNKYPEGRSTFGVEDMIGNVWQMTGDVYDNGAYYFNIIRGGSYYHPTQSIWYVTGGPLPADHPEMLLLIAPALDRNATVGFRCVKDAGK